MTIVTKSSCKRELAWCGSMHGVIRTNICLNHNNYPDSGRQHRNTTYRSWNIKTWTNTSKDKIKANILASRCRWRALPHVRLSCAKGIHKICVSTEFSLGLLPWTRFSRERKFWNTSSMLCSKIKCRRKCIHRSFLSIHVYKCVYCSCSNGC